MGKEATRAFTHLLSGPEPPFCALLMFGVYTLAALGRTLALRFGTERAFSVFNPVRSHQLQ